MLQCFKLTVLIGDHLPELGSDLITALASLDVDDLSHCMIWFGGC
jgi:hypothetical protein